MQGVEVVHGHVVSDTCARTLYACTEAAHRQQVQKVYLAPY